MIKNKVKEIGRFHPVIGLEGPYSIFDLGTRRG